MCYNLSQFGEHAAARPPSNKKARIQETVAARLGDKTVESGVRPPAAGGSTATSEYSNTVEVNDAPTCGWNGAAWPFAYASEQRKRPPETVAFFVSGGDELSTVLTPNTRMISARFPHDLAAQLRALAEQKQRGVSELIIEAVAETVRKESERHAEHTPAQAV